MRVLHCIHSLSGGGAETQLALLANELASAGHDVSIFYVAGEPEEDGVVYYHCGAGKYPRALLSEIDAVIDDFEPDIVHVWIPAVMNIAGLLAAKRRCLPVVTSIRNKRRIDGFVRFLSYLTTFAASDKVISNNPIQQSSLPYRKLFAYKQGEVISNAVNVENEQVLGEKPINKRCRLIYVGRLTQQKNVSVLIEALALINTSRHWRLDVFGQGEEREALSELVNARNLQDSIQFHGYSDSVKKHIYQADLLILPSLYEGMPNVVVEALALGTPALVSNISANTLLFTGGEVVFFESDNAVSLAGALNEFFEGTFELQRLISRGAEFVESRTIEKVGKRYIEAYQAVIDVKRKQSSVNG